MERFSSDVLTWLSATVLLSATTGTSSPPTFEPESIIEWSTEILNGETQYRALNHVWVS
jgi:hypothetical protein